MSQVINTNIMSLTAQRNLNNSQSALATAMQRLSSGLRINSAKDDAAGLAISTRFTTQINGLNTAVRNANDGISLAQTTESALQELTNNLQAIRQLAVQSANATNSDSDRAALDAEVQQRLSEITRISQQTTFNGRHVLDGSFGSAAFQVGANVGETITINLSQGTTAAQIGGVASASATGGTAFAASAGSSATASVATVNGVAGFDYSTTGKTFTVDGNTVNLNAAYGSQAAMVTAVQGQLNAAAAGKYTVANSGADGFTITTTATGAASAITVGGADAAFVNSNVAGADAVAAGTVTPETLASGDFSLNGKNITGTFANAQALADGINAVGIPGVSAYLDGSGALKIQSQGALTVGGAKDAALGFTAGATAASGSLQGVDVKSVAGANDVINRVDAALTTVSGVRSDLGAIQNRFDSTISNLQAISENLSASRSRIQDTDFAAETANMSRAQILQQAGVSMLAQANAAPQTVLKLLQ
ncbi:MAG: flagellin [Xanthomonadales bacterium]|nr:flagellin [Xanthomonadales bacterium]ODU95272.1 MAG: flagellin [Rhodanobacter sp. SCN 66-43]OJY82998.1 MAG: flagellin [Xanthomonadales bacterium 66-474]